MAYLNKKNEIMYDDYSKVCEYLINKNIYPKNKEDLKVEEDDQGSALGSIGLKPKIVH